MIRARDVSILLVVTCGALCALGSGCSKDPELIDIRIKGGEAPVPAGLSQQLTAMGLYADRSTKDLTKDVTWSSKQPAIATFDTSVGQGGVLLGVSPGAATVEVRLGEQVSVGLVTITNAVVKSIAVTPHNRLIAKGTTLKLAAAATYSDKTSKDVTTQVLWSSSDEKVASFVDKGGQGLASGLAPGLVTVTATLAGATGSVTLGVSDAALLSIALTPPSPAIAKGTTQQLVATGTFSDETTQDLTSLVVWATADVRVATVSNAPGQKGLTTGAGAGSTSVTAALFGQSGAATFAVSNATLLSIAISPPNPFLPSGITQALTATGTFSDQTTQDLTSTVTWTSSDNRVATVAAGGTASALIPGVAKITATQGMTAGSITLGVKDATLVSIGVTPPTPTLAKGTTTQLVATGTYSDLTTQDISSLVSWSSSDTEVAVLSNAAGSRGMTSALGKGEITLTATLAGKSGTAALKVSDAVLVSIGVDPQVPVRAKGTTQQFSATGTYSDGTSQDLTEAVTWTSKMGAATISNAAGTLGLATATAKGSTTISAALSGKTGTTTLLVTEATITAIDVTPQDPSIAKGTVVQLVAVATYSDGTSQDVSSLVTWSSSEGTVATASNAAGLRGLATSIAKGTTMIGAALGGMTGTTTLEVTDATLTTITVTPPSPVRNKGTVQPCVAVGTFSDKSTQDLTTLAAWESSDEDVAVISNAGGSEGLATALRKGFSLISASFGGKTTTIRLTVTDAALVAIHITPPAPILAKGTYQQLVATGTYSDATTQDLSSLVTWSSSDMTTATVSNAAGAKGLANALAKGMTTISAGYDGREGDITLMVSDATLTALSVTPTNPTVAKGTTQQFSATGIYSDGSTQDLTTAVTWDSQMDAVASVSNAMGSEGLATATDKGTTSIVAQLGGLSASTLLSVSDATLMDIDVMPSDLTLANGTTGQLTATGTYSDGSMQDLTSLVTWAIADAAFATVSNAAGSKGLTTATAKGSTNVTATFAGITGTAPLAVSDATLASIAITPAAPIIAKGTEVQLRAMGIFSDGTTQDLTMQVAWESTSEMTATVSSAAGSEGLATSAAKGTTTIKATMGAIVGTTLLTVSDAVLVQLVVTPVAPVLNAGDTEQLFATGIYSDASQQDLTSSVTWSSSDMTVATVSNAAGTKGRATAVATGTSTLRATLGGKTNTTLLTVN